MRWDYDPSLQDYGNLQTSARDIGKDLGTAFLTWESAFQDSPEGQAAAEPKYSNLEQRGCSQGATAVENTESSDPKILLDLSYQQTNDTWLPVSLVRWGSQPVNCFLGSRWVTESKHWENLKAIWHCYDILQWNQWHILYRSWTLGIVFYFKAYVRGKIGPSSQTVFMPTHVLYFSRPSHHPHIHLPLLLTSPQRKTHDF